MIDDARLRPSGRPPYWRPGTHIWWRYRRAGWRPGLPQHVAPVRVIRDDASALVAWLAPGTPVLRAVLADGDEVRSVGLDRLYHVPRVQGLKPWRGTGTLMIAPTGWNWSVWLFWDETWRLRHWYVNLEAPHVRDDRNVVSQDRVLDLVVMPDRTVTWKDEDELAAAVAAGRYTEAEATRFAGHAREAERQVAAWGYPFCDGWQEWRADPDWSIPDVPTDVVPDVVDPALATSDGTADSVEGPRYGGDRVTEVSK